MAYRIGVVSDTHCPEFAPSLPEALFAAFRGSDLILHAGDITEEATLEQLRAIAPVYAVQGNHDDHLDLPRSRVIEAGGVRIGLTHGHRGRVREFPGVAWNEAFAGRHWWWNGGLGNVLETFAGEPLAAIVFGHFHVPHASLRASGEGTPLLLFSPGATYHCVAEEARRRYERGGPPHHRLYYRSRMRWQPRAATAGLLHIRDGAIRPEFVHLGEV
jgi:putative phosphoesterase